MGTSCLYNCISIGEEETKKLELGCYQIANNNNKHNEDFQSDLSQICDLSLPSVSDTDSRWSLKLSTPK